MSDVVDLRAYKIKTENLFNLEQARADVEQYRQIVMKSVRDFHTFSVQEKVELYSSLAVFNVEILRQLLEYKKGEVV